MTVIATSETRFSQVVKEEFAPETRFCRDVVTVNDSAQTISVGAVLGKVTATGKYKLSTSAAADGSQNPVAIVIEDSLGLSRDTALAANTDTKFVVLSRGPVIVSDQLQLGTGMTVAAVKTALAPQGIIVETSA